MAPRNGSRVVLVLAGVLVITILFSYGLIAYYVFTLDVSSGAKLASLGEHLSALVQTLIAGIVGWLVGKHEPPSTGGGGGGPEH